MKRIDLSKTFKNLQNMAVRRSPEILVGIGITGMVSAIVMGITSTPKAMKNIDHEKKRLKKIKLTKKETLKVTWRCYVPTVVTVVVSSGCIIGSSRVNLKRNAALATAYSLSESAFREYQEKVVGTIGGKKEKEIRDAVVTDRLNRNEFEGSEIILTGYGNTLCIDDFSGQPFESSIDKIRKVEGELNKRLYANNYISLNEFWYELGLQQTSMGNDFGWNLSTNGCIDLEFTSTIKNDRPCIIMKHKTPPRPDYCFYY